MAEITIKFFLLLSVAFSLVLSSYAAFAQEPAKEFPNINLSNKGRRILCEKSPLNSRCPNGQPLTDTASPLPDARDSSPLPDERPANSERSDSESTSDLSEEGFRGPVRTNGPSIPGNPDRLPGLPGNPTTGPRIPNNPGALPGNSTTGPRIP